MLNIYNKMIFDISFLQVVLLIFLGVLAGIINTLAGGGSNLTIPALMILGMPADVANATNRVGVLLQSLVGVSEFKRHNKLPTNDIAAMILPLIIGSLFGAGLASYAPENLLKYMLLGAMISVALLVLIYPDVISPPDETSPVKVSESLPAWWLLVLAGFYGGFVQAGVGFILVTVFAGVLRYELVASHALKILATVFFTSIAIIIFIYNEQVSWVPGLILAIGTMLGAYIGVRLSLNLSKAVMRWFLFLMTLVASVAALL